MDQHVNAGGAKGVQVGDHNTQISYFTAQGQSQAAVDLQALHPRAAARRVRGMPAEDGATLVAQLAQQPAVDLLEELLLHDEPVAVAVLTSMHPARAQELIESLAAVADWLADLPRAAAAIRTVHDAAAAALGEEQGPIGRVAGRAPTPTGFRLACATGVVHWSADTGAFAVSGPILAYHEAAGGVAGRLGFPVGPEEGGRQAFQGPRRDVVITSRHGTFSSYAWLIAWAKRERRRLGPPLAEGSLRDKRWMQRFETVDVHVDAAGRPTAVGGEIREAWRAFKTLGFATSRAMVGPASPSGLTGLLQRFEDDFRPDRAATVYSTTRCTAVVHEPILGTYADNGGPGGWLGYPVRPPTTVPGFEVQVFEHGVIVSGAVGTFTVSVPVYEAARDARLGGPVGTARRLGEDGDQAQFFERGLVTVRDGTVETWRSDSEA